MAALMAAKKGLKGMLKADTMDSVMVERRDERTVAGKAASMVLKMVA